MKRVPASSELIRRATTSDITDVLRLWRDIPASRTDDEEALVALLHHPTSHMLVAEADGTIVGSVIAAWDGWRGELYRLAVAEDYRRTGIGTRLVRRAEAQLLEQGARRINALVLHRSGEAVDFWTSAGYRLDERIGRFIRGSGSPG